MVSTAVALLVTIGLTLSWGAVGTAVGVLTGDLILLSMLLAGLRQAKLSSRASDFVAVPVIAAGVGIAAPIGFGLGAMLALPLGLAILTLILWITRYIQPVFEQVVAVARSGSAPND